MKYILVTRAVEETEDTSKALKFVTRKRESDGKLFYMAKDEKGQTGYVTREWIVNNINNILNCGLSGSSIYPLVKSKEERREKQQETQKAEESQPKSQLTIEELRAQAEETYEKMKPIILKYFVAKIKNGVLITDYDKPEHILNNAKIEKIRITAIRIDRAVPSFKIWDKIYEELLNQSIKAIDAMGTTVYKAGCHVDMNHQAYTDDECIGCCYTTNEELGRKYVMNVIKKHSNDYDVEASEDELINNIFSIPVTEYIG